MEEIILYFSYIVISVLALVYGFYTYKFSYWKKYNVPYTEPTIPFGNLSLGSTLNELLSKSYLEKKVKCPIVGVYFFFSPLSIATDLDFIKHILIKDFNNFTDRGLYYNEKDDPLSAHLFSLDGEKWRNLRSKLSPTFTSGKMKFMFPTIINVANEFQLVMKDVIRNENEIEIKDLLARFTTDIIGTCAFGIECNSLKDPNAEFRKYGRLVFESPTGKFERIIKQQNKEIARFLRLRNIKKPIEDFFLNVVRQTVEFREKNNIRRNDFLDLLIELKNGNSENGKPIHGMTIEEIAAQVFVFFLAGFETSSSTISYCLYELSLNQDVQNKVRSEITNILKKYNGEFTYEAMVEMTYLEQTVIETLRKYPPVTALERVAIKDYKIPDTDIILVKGTKVMIPVYSIHNDPEIYPNPENFDPDRFRADVVKERHPLSFLGFGDGPRNCIGLRFGKMQTKIGLVMLLTNFKFKPGQKTKIPLEFDRNIPLLTAKGGMWLKVENI